jgi:hypothetical protein
VLSGPGRRGWAEQDWWAGGREEKDAGGEKKGNGPTEDWAAGKKKKEKGRIMERSAGSGKEKKGGIRDGLEERREGR